MRTSWTSSRARHGLSDSSDATAVSGCGAQPLTQVSSSTYTATCTTTAVSAGDFAHAITASYSGDSTYPSSTGTLAGSQAVTPVPLTVTASSGSMTYGAAPPAITPSYTGFVNGDGPGSLHPAPACSTNATSSSPARTYPSDCTGAADPNYVSSYAGGTVAVTPAATAVAYTGPQSVARGASFTPAATLSSPASACQPGQPVSFTLNASLKTGAPGRTRWSRRRRTAPARRPAHPCPPQAGGPVPTASPPATPAPRTAAYRPA